MYNQINALNWDQPIGEDWNMSGEKYYSSSNKKENGNVFGVAFLRT
jgi:hypothetical protein